LINDFKPVKRAIEFGFGGRSLPPATRVFACLGLSPRVAFG
jgi:hypothetical protein